MLNASTVPQRNVVAWVLQGNPAHFDIDTYFSRSTFIYWNCTRFADQFRVGAPVLFKRSGRGGGVIAHGFVAELPKPADQVDKPEFLGTDLWAASPPDEAIPKVGVMLSEVRLTVDEGMVETRTVEGLPELREHPLVSFRQGTVFRLSEEQSNALQRAWGAAATVDESLPVGSVEGRRTYVRHRHIERNRRLIEDKKATFFAEHGRLACEVCRVDFSRYYPSELVQHIIEVHHLRPLADLAGPCYTEMDDLMLVCSNCHSLIHRTKECNHNLSRLRRHFDTRRPETQEDGLFYN